MRETSWANIRDRMAVGHFQVAHMLAPMPIACNLGLTPLAVPTIAPMALGLGGNAITVSNALWAQWPTQGANAGSSIRRRPALPLQAVVADASRAGRSRRCALPWCIRYSGHNYELRYWLAACGIDPARTSRSSSCRRR